MAGQDAKNIWQDEDELRRMIIEAEENEFWRVEPADEIAGEADGNRAPFNAAALRLRAWMNAAASDSGLADVEEKSIQDGE